jgi:hypothetical protein
VILQAPPVFKSIEGCRLVCLISGKFKLAVLLPVKPFGEHTVTHSRQWLLHASFDAKLWRMYADAWPCLQGFWG